MTDDLERGLERLFADEQARQTKVDDRRKRRVVKQAEFLALFRVAAEEVIIPTFENFGRRLLAHGWAAQVVTQREQQGANFGPDALPEVPEAVRLTFSKAGATLRGADGQGEPAFTVTCDKVAKAVVISGSTPASSQRQRSVDLSELDTDHLNQEMLRYLKQLISDTRSA